MPNSSWHIARRAASNTKYSLSTVIGLREWDRTNGQAEALDFDILRTENGQTGEALRFFVEQKGTFSLFLTVLIARKETLSPDLVVNCTRVGFLTVLTATKLTFLLATHV